MAFPGPSQFWHLTINIICKRTNILSDVVVDSSDFMSLGIYFKFRFNSHLQEVGKQPWHGFFFLSSLSLIFWSKDRPDAAAF